MDAGKTGEFIALRRKALGLTQKELAQKLSVSDKAISRWETGKGYPDTALLKPLSDVLGISVSELLAGEAISIAESMDKTDQVLVQSLEHSDRKLGKAWRLCLALGILAVILLLMVLIPFEQDPSAVQLINSSDTSLLYKLGDDNKRTNIVFPDLIYQQLPAGYGYVSESGDTRCVFLENSKYAADPVMSYMHCSGQGSIFGFDIGKTTVIEANPALDIPGGSLVDYLMGQGFSRAMSEEFGRTSLTYINGERCNWYAFTKEDVYILLCISAYKEQTLRAFDVGLMGENMQVLWQQLLGGYRLTVEDPLGLVAAPAAGQYPQLGDVTVTVRPTEQNKTLYLYLDGELIDKFPVDEDLVFEQYSLTFNMPGRDCVIKICP